MFTVLGHRTVSVLMSKVMYQSKSKVQHPRASDDFVVPGGGECDPYTYGVGNLNWNLDFVLRVAVIERGLINHGDTVLNGEL